LLSVLDEAWELYGNSSLSIPGIHNTLRLRETFYIFDDMCSSITEAGAACCPCCSSLCISQFCQFCQTIMTKVQLFISYMLNIFCCIFHSNLIPIDFIWPHK
jgi:hypothetical protein